MSVNAETSRRGMPRDGHAGMSLFTLPGERKYLNAAERLRILDAINGLEPQAFTFILALLWTGARVSEVLALTPGSIDLDEHAITIRTLKRRRVHIRQVPIPPFLTLALDQHFDLRALQANASETQRPLWSYCRQTAWRLVKRVMRKTGIHGVRATPKGFRHAFAIAALHARVPLNIVQRWMGHARMETTAIYSDAIGPDERDFAERMWKDWTSATASRSKAERV